MANQKLHCDHECVCWWYYKHKHSGSAASCSSELCHHRTTQSELSLERISAINVALLKLYPEDFSLQINISQILQLQKEHKAILIHGIIDNCTKEIQKRIDKIFEAYSDETNEKITDLPFTMANGMGEAQNIIKSLYQKESLSESSEPDYVHINDGSDKDWRLISMYELKKLEHAINEECVGKNDRCPKGHLKEMHDSGNEVIDKARNRIALKIIGSY